MNKCVMVVGATKGIGLATVKKFAENGFDVVATYNKGNLKDAKTFCEKENVKFLPIKMDISNFQEVEKGFAKAFYEMKKIDVIVCNSGISLGEKLLCDQEIIDINKLIDVNLKGIIYCNREAQKHLINQKSGNIVNVSSIYGLYGGCCEAVYSASKGGIIALTKALSDECAFFGVRVNAVAPGCIETSMTDCFSDEEKKIIQEKTPLKKLGKPQDVANVIYFISSDDASFITGEVLTVSGGVLKF